MEFFSRYAGKENKIARRHEKAYMKSLFKGAVKDPFESLDKQDKDVRRFEAAQITIASDRANRKYERAQRKKDIADAKRWDKEMRKS
jgi:hypothetical protein